MSKKLLVLAGSLLAVAALASWSWAGDYHMNQQLICQDCHVMHYSQAHGYNDDGTGNFTSLGAGGPYHYLLRNDINELCLSCHNGSASAPDVFEAHANGYVRQAGALNEVGGNNNYEEGNGHTLGSDAIAPGGTFANADGLNCVNCHAPHGRQAGLVAPYNVQGGYRNLFLEVTGFTSISYTRGDVEGANTAAAWIHEDASSGVNANHYGRGGITFNEPDQTDSRYADFCQGCHTNFHGAIGGPEVGGTGTPAEEFVRHPMAGVNIGAIGGGHSNLSRIVAKGANQIQVMSPTGVKAGSYTAADNQLTPSCMSCHKGHGNQNAFGLVYMVGTGTITEEGDNGIDARNTCRQCHTQGGAVTNPW